MMKQVVKVDSQGTPRLVQKVEFLRAGKNLKLSFAFGKKKLIALQDIFPREADFLELPSDVVFARIETYCETNWRAIQSDLDDSLIQGAIS